MSRDLPPDPEWSLAWIDGHLEEVAEAVKVLAAAYVRPGAPEPVDSITVRQDVGGHYPQYKRVTLDLMPDGTVRWRDVEYDS